MHYWIKRQLPPVDLLMFGVPARPNNYGVTSHPLFGHWSRWDDPLVVMTLAEGCAQICFALEEERAVLMTHREKEYMANRRKVRDERQREMYHPVNGEGEVCGRDGVEKALMHTLSGEKKYNAPNVILEDREATTPTLDPIERVQDGEESEITEEIEDLKTNEDDKNWTPIDSVGKEITYEHDDSTPNNVQEKEEGADGDSNDNFDAEEAYDAFQESILQFHKRLNEVLDEAKGSKLSSVIEKKLMKDNKLKRGDDGNETENPQDQQRGSQSSFANAQQSLVKYRWKILLLGVIGFIATMAMTWFALGCYGFYTLFLGGSSSPSLLPFNNSGQQQPVVIQVVAGKASDASNFAHMSLEEWKQMSKDVESAIRKQMDEL